MTARDGQDLFGLSPAPAPAADHTALLAGWKQGLARLAPTRDPCPGFRAGQWPRVHAAALDFLANTAEAAAALGWSTVALFGVHPVVGVRRVDCCGALMVSSGSPIAEVTPERIRYRNGLAYRRTPERAGLAGRSRARRLQSARINQCLSFALRPGGRKPYGNDDRLIA